MADREEIDEFVSMQLFLVKMVTVLMVGFLIFAWIFPKTTDNILKRIDGYFEKFPKEK